jgi:large subunit ribosomal protein L4
MSVTAPLYDSEGTRVSEVELPEHLFGIEPHLAALHAYTKTYQTNQRQGTVKTKTRSEVRGGGRKPWRQKGTGRARAGTNTSPIWVGGGRAFGPRPRKHHEKMPKKVRRLAMRSALSLRAGTGNVHVIEDMKIDPPKTKQFAQILKNIGLDATRVLFLSESTDINLGLSVRNLPYVHHQRASLSNPYEVMRSHDVLLTKTGLDKLAEMFAS